MIHAPIPAAVPAASLPLALDIPPAAAILAAAGLFFPISNAAGASTPRPCAPPWNRPSAPPMPPAPGTGRRPTMPARRRPSCSCANTERRFSAKPRLRLPGFPHCRRSPGSCRPIRAGPRRRRPSSSSRRRSRSAWSRLPPPPSRRPTVCWSLRPAPGLLAILAEIAGASLILNELAETRAGLLSSLFPAIPVTRFDAAQIDDHLDRRRRAERRADEPAILGHGQCRGPRGRRRLAPYRLGAGAPGARRAAGRRSPARTSRPSMPAWRDGLRPPAGARPRRLLRGDRRARSMPSMARPSRRASPSSTRRRPTIPAVFPAARRRRARCRDAARLGRASMCRRGCRSRMPAGRSADTTGRTAHRARLSRPHGAADTARRRIAEPEGVELAYETVDWTAAPRAAASAMRSTRTMRFRRSVFPALRRIRPSSCSRRPWPRSRRRSRATGRACRAIVPTSSPTPSSRP